MTPEQRVKAIAFYFPQFHAIPENDEWWGKGFTDWVNVKKAKPLFKGHYQPRVPLGGRYYDQSRKEVVAQQIDLAKRHGLGGFCHYHYWFDDKQLLETPTNIVMDSPELDFPFCLAWANETWSRRWDGRDHHILIAQTHKPEESRWQKHFDYLIRAWKDPRAIKIDGRPVFLIYRPQRIIELDRMLEFWREKAREQGLEGVYFIAIKQYELPKPELFDKFDAVVQFQPFETLYSPDFPVKGVMTNRLTQRFRLLPERVQAWLSSVRNAIPRPTFLDYDLIWTYLLQRQRERDLPTLAGAFMDWDNTARYGKRATVFRGASPERFEYWFKQLVDQVEQRPENERMIFLNAWNEWAEGTYLEPDERYGYQYIEALQRCLQAPESATTPKAAGAA